LRRGRGKSDLLDATAQPCSQIKKYQKKFQDDADSPLKKGSPKAALKAETPVDEA
jgi:hypothetical protein